MSRLLKGSPTAMAWAKKMKKARIRAAGLRTERQFFGPGGEFEDERAAKQRTNPKPYRHEGPTWGAIVDYLKHEGWKPRGKKGVASFGRHTGGLYQVLQLEARAWRVLYSTVVTFTTRSLGTYKDLDRAVIAANRQASEYLRKKKNPKRNPPGVAGVMYNKVHEVQAEKTGQHKHKGLWYHPFKGKSQVEMLALDNGDILLHSKGGKKLWRKA